MYIQMCITRISRHLAAGAAMRHAATPLAAVAALLLAVSAQSCRDSTPEAVRGGATGSVSLPPDSLMESIPVGDIAGATPNSMASTIPNPYANDAAAVQAGQQLMTRMNCVSCHAYTLKGSMGPNLTDRYWRYGGAPAQIYESIYKGRPQGMPAWGRALTKDEIWKIVAYIQSKGGTFPASLANAGMQGNLGDEDTTGGAAQKGRQNEH